MSKSNSNTPQSVASLGTRSILFLLDHISRTGPGPESQQAGALADEWRESMGDNSDAAPAKDDSATTAKK